MTDPVALLRELISCRSVTPEDGGALSVVERTLAQQGFRIMRLKFSEAGTPDVENLFARYGAAGPHFCFAGHTDVVPPGDVAGWSHPPFAGEEDGGHVYGRGASDMKGPVAAFVAAACDFVAARPSLKGSVSVLLTGDEEGPAINGTLKVLRWLSQQAEVPDHCLLGEPTCGEALGDRIKAGRRGSLNVAIVAKGRQGHSAYPHLADNPIPRLIRLLDRLASHRLDEGTEHFEPSHVALTSVDVGNAASNIIPARAEARLNIRFNTLHSAKSLAQWIETEARRVETEMGGRFEITFSEAAEAFLTEAGAFVDLVRAAVSAETGIVPEISTSGGTSDARFIKNFCPVVEFGSTNATIHQVDERISIAELQTLKRIYEAVLESYFGAA